MASTRKEIFKFGIIEEHKVKKAFKSFLIQILKIKLLNSKFKHQTLVVTYSFFIHFFVKKEQQNLA